MIAGSGGGLGFGALAVAALFLWRAAVGAVKPRQWVGQLVVAWPAQPARIVTNSAGGGRT